jgi:trehalose 6-phosphate synthase
MNRHVPADDLLVFYIIADVAMITPVIDGMNLVAKEYIAVNDQGVLILSEFAGASEEVKDALIVNPYDVDMSALAIEKALSMTLEQRNRHAQALRRLVREHDIFWWLDTFLKEWDAGGKNLTSEGEDDQPGDRDPMKIDRLR